jgi:hypothetical protein
MAFQVRWTHGSDEGVWMFGTEDEATDAALAVEGTALMFEEPAGSVRTFRNGRELGGAEASDATIRFGYHIEVGISRAGEPETNIDPSDSTGSGWRPETATVWGWRLWKGKEGASPWVGTFSRRELAKEAAEEARAAAERGDERADPDLAGLPFIDIGPTNA